MLESMIYFERILLNACFASIVSVLITNILFSIIARIFNYDFIFAIETGRIIFDLDKEFYSDTYAGIRGFALHMGAVLLFMMFYTVVLLPLLALIPYMGAYIYETPNNTAVTENLVWLMFLGYSAYLIWYSQDRNFDKFAFFLLIYISCLIFITAVLYGLYIFGPPGILVL